MYAEIESVDDDYIVKQKKPNFFKRWLINCMKDAIDYEQTNQRIGRSRQHRGMVTIDDYSMDLDKEKSIRFNIYNANGGRVVETTRFDRQKDRNITNLYVITSEQEFGREIDKIITMEYIKQ